MRQHKLVHFAAFNGDSNVTDHHAANSTKVYRRAILLEKRG